MFQAHQKNRNTLFRLKTGLKKLKFAFFMSFMSLISVLRNIHSLFVKYHEKLIDTCFNHINKTEIDFQAEN